MIEHGLVDATVDDIERALDALVCEIVKLREMLPPQSTEALNQALYARSGPAVTPFKVAVDLIANSPVDGALRLSVRQMGEELFRNLRSPPKMMQLARRVCSKDEPNWSRRMTVIDAAWEGIGSEDDGYWGWHISKSTLR
ncbi:MAG: hypothetical protein HC850_11950 [Rhodomicrobium sp.]|nr:hypothetical protein [Rhodomicrobium sp.]